MRLLIVPRWAGSPESDFYVWLRASLAAHKTFSTISLCVLPNPPEVEPSVRQVCEALAQSEEPTLLMGHSVGFQAAMRAAAQRKVAGLLGVAGWWSVDAPWPSITPWVETPFDYQAVIQNAPHRMVLLSDNDPFTSDAAQTQRLFHERIRASAKILHGRKHFNQGEEPDVLEALRSLTKEIESGLVSDESPR